MLSISNVANSAAASSYYEQADDYYSADRSPSLWSGQAAAALGLSGDVRPEDFRAMLDGRLANGETLHHTADGRRGGIDLTFSAPKSVSLEALVAGDTRLLAAHETAVARALDYAESLAACRVTQNRETHKEVTGNLAIAQFRHDLSRAADPQLHTHCVALNVTQRADGQWRAIDNEAFYRNKMLLGAYYRSELAKEVQALGYGVRLTHPDGRFELSHISRSQVQTFSTRSQRIEEKLKAQGLTRDDVSAQQLQVIALQTREQKSELDRATLKTEWEVRAREAGLQFQPLRAARQPDAEQRVQFAERAVSYATAHLSERQAVLHHIDLNRVALERGTGQTDWATIRAVIEDAVARGELIRSGDRYTTPAAQQMERDILALEAGSRGQVAPILSKAAVTDALALTTLNDGQRQAVAQTLTTENRITGIQGAAGTGKTTALRVTRTLAESQDVRVIGVAPSASAARELGQSGIPSETLAALKARDFRGLDAQTLVVLDEAGMVSVRDMHALLSAADKAQARVLLVGDVRQLKAVEAGKPFEQLQVAEMATAKLDEIQRQKEAGLKAAVELAAAGKVQASIARLEPHIVEIVSRPERHAHIAADYAALQPQARSSTLIVAGTNQSRQQINQAVRESLGLAGQGESFITLNRKDLSRAEALRSVSYQPGDMVRADKEYRSLGLQAGDFARVVEGPAGAVTLERADGARVAWRPATQTHLSAYTEHQRELAPGDLIRLTENDYRQGIVNGDRATVLGREPETQRLLIEKTDGSRLTLDPRKPLYIDHGYCQTVHSAQGQTCERVLIEAEAGKTIGNESMYYVAISRAQHEVKLYTDDKGSLPQVMGREDIKASALDISEKSLNETLKSGPVMQR